MESSPICGLSKIYGNFDKYTITFEVYYIVAAMESFSSLTACFPSRSSLFTTRGKRYVGREEAEGSGGGGGGVLREPLSTHQHRALPHIHLLLCCSGGLNTSVQLVVVRVMRKHTLIFRFSAECNSTLGLGDRSLPDPALNASSAWDDDKAAKARLHRDGGWRADYEAGLWLQVALDNVTNITAIATQGYSSGDYWTKLYRLESGLDGNDWQLYGKVRGIFRAPYHYPEAFSHIKAKARSTNNSESNRRDTGSHVLLPWSRGVTLTFITNWSAMICYVTDILRQSIIEFNYWLN